MITNLLLKRLLLLWVFAFSTTVWGQTYFDMSSADYSQNFNGITTLPTNFNTVSVLNTGSIPAATKTTSSSTNALAVVASAAAVGIDASSSTKLVFLTTGATDNTTSIATDLNLNFANRTAGNLSFDASTIFNGTGNRVSSLKVYYSLNGTTWTELTGTNLPYVATNNVAGSSAINITLTSALNNEANVKFRFYYHNGSGGSTGSRPRIGIDNLSVTSTSFNTTVPNLSISGNLGHGATCENTEATNITYTITNNGTLADGITVTSSDPQFVVSDISSTSIPANGTATFKVTFTPTSAGDKSSTITVTSTTAGSNTATYGLTGKGLNTPPTVTTPTSALIAANSATLGGNITIQGCSPITERGIYYSTTNNFAEGTGTKVPEEGSFTTGVFTVNASGLNSSTTYYYRAFATSESGTAYSTQGTFITTAIASPVATAATDIAETGFTANWEVVAGATSYKLDVYAGAITPIISTETFTGVAGGNASSYLTRTWSGDEGISWTAYKSRIDQVVNNGNPAIALQDATGAYLQSDAINGTLKSISFDLKQAFTGGGGILTLKILSGTGFSEEKIIGNYPYTTSVQTVIAPISPNVTGPFKVILVNNTASRAIIDNLKIERLDVSLIYSIENQDVENVTSYTVSDLNSGTKYYYRVRAKDATSESVNSNVIDVTTLGSITWGNSGWSNEIGPDAAKNAVIDYDYTGAAFEAKSVKVNSDATLTINSSVTTGDVTNNGAIILNDGASFIQSSTGLYDGSGTFKVNRNTESEAAKYAFWSSPVVNQDMYGIFPTAPEYVMIYNTGSNYYDIVTGPANASKGIGYSISTPSPAPGAAAFLGAPHNGTFNTVLALDSYKFNLVGNPYPSNLDLTKLLSANSDNIESTIWFWDNKSGPVKTQNGTTAASNGYATFNAAGTGVWVPATSVSASEVKSGVTAKIGQGFIVKAKSSALLFNNDMRTADVGSNFNKSTGNADEGKYWLTLTTPYNTKITQAITYQNGGSDRYDDYDSKARSNGSDAFYSLAGAEKVIIQGKAPFNADDIVVLGNKHFENGNFKIELTKTEGLFAEGQAIYLRDKVTGTETNLQEGTYLFASNAGDFTDRFEVVYSKTVLGTNAAAKSTLAVYRNGDDFVIDSPSKIVAVEVYDASGKLMKSFKSNSNKETVSNLSRGVYILKITTATETVSKKVIK